MAATSQPLSGDAPISFSDIDDYLQNSFEADREISEIAHAVAVIERLGNKLTQHQASRVLEALPQRISTNVEPSDNAYGAGFSLAKEIDMQLKAVHAMRISVMHSDGTPKEGIDPRDIKDSITAANTMISTLLKQHEKVMSMERNRAVEAATIEALQQLKAEHGQDAVDLYMGILETKLEAIA